ncbi:hypothetical protein C3496_00475 [Bacillus anthracis]|uniref:hypothetical protein n=1 Tax=Bacillus TaxID=1386 RepID=UPI0010A69A5F|nr:MULTISPECIES: hypothetical protein [Bacillus]QBJ65027.1 hypothetical protein C3496_00475 [Bacillus anthracis]THG54702.1 hypothetical protein E7Y01_27225 [Bacillus sp. HUB-I-004]
MKKQAPIKVLVFSISQNLYGTSECEDSLYMMEMVYRKFAMVLVQLEKVAETIGLQMKKMNVAKVFFELYFLIENTTITHISP